MFHVAVKNIGDRLDPRLRMPGKTLQIITRLIAAKIVEKQERIKFWIHCFQKASADGPRPSIVGLLLITFRIFLFVAINILLHVTPAFSTQGAVFL